MEHANGRYGPGIGPNLVEITEWADLHHDLIQAQSPCRIR